MDLRDVAGNSADNTGRDAGVLWGDDVKPCELPGDGVVRISGGTESGPLGGDAYRQQQGAFCTRNTLHTRYALCRYNSLCAHNPSVYPCCLCVP